MNSRAWMTFALLGLLLVGAGCSTFNREWREAGSQPAPASRLAGRWEGRWQSEANGHNDTLRAIITGADTHGYNVQFDAAFKHWLTLFITIHADYTVRMEAAPSANGMTFRGSEDLGWLSGGVYTYEGRADGTNFFSTYHSKYDWGKFEMKRPNVER
jgi:hypothetical protein